MKKAILTFLLIFLMPVISYAKPSISTSIFILSTIVKEIGGNKVNVSYIIPPAANPHIFSPKPMDLINFEKANLFIGIGYNFEFWFNSVSYMRKNKRNLFLSELYKNSIDEMVLGKKIIANPHIWLDIGFVQRKVVPKITDYLCSIDKKNCSLFERNEKKLLRKLSSILELYRGLSKKLKEYCIIDIKPAFEYFLKSIHKRSCDVVVKRGNQVPTMGDLKDVFLNCKCRKGIVIYINNINLAKTIANKLSYKIVRLNPLGNPENPYENTYTKLLKTDFNIIKRAVK